MRTKIFIFLTLIASNVFSQTNSFYPATAGNTTATGTANTGVGSDSMKNLSTGTLNSAFGAKSLGRAGVTGDGNVAIGFQSMGVTQEVGIVSGDANTAVGAYSLARLTSGIYNVSIGNNSLQANTEGSNNSVLGTQAMMLNSVGTNNIGVGYRALYKNTTGNYNIGMGDLALQNSISGNNNIAIGNKAGFNTTGTKNIFLGNNAGANVGGAYNVILGGYEGNPATDGSMVNTIIVATAGHPTSASGVERFRITQAGFMGLGTATPGNKLEVDSETAGNSGLRFSQLNAATPWITNNTNNKFLSLNADGDVILQNLPSSTAGLNIYNSNGVLQGERIVAMDNNRLIFDTETNGRIYIGNTLTSPSPFNTSNFPAVTGANNNYKLLVEGGVLAEKVKVALRSGADWKDDVFANDYKLMPLQEVETFVKENKHLPGIESADELVKSGLDLGEMQAKQMGKIEELTLYVIEQNKEIEELKAQVKLLMEKK